MQGTLEEGAISLNQSVDFKTFLREWLLHKQGVALTTHQEANHPLQHLEARLQGTANLGGARKALPMEYLETTLQGVATALYFPKKSWSSFG